MEEISRGRWSASAAAREIIEAGSRAPMTKIVNYGLIAECVFVRVRATGSQNYRAILGRFGSLPYDTMGAYL